MALGTWNMLSDPQWSVNVALHSQWKDAWCVGLQPSVCPRLPVPSPGLRLDPVTLGSADSSHSKPMIVALWVGFWFLGFFPVAFQ